ncbi:hypothetical protein Bca4012_100777 [Brassica carinata]|uniref:Uncharacterized protein n=1 Tax=Brassica carinata TaxID=52824 RepID=A0A8X7PJW6_BRACI|nr:hypothetical protein Bca52824_083257 [Brassica carinata]
MTKEPKLQGARRIVTENGPILLSRHENSQQKSWVKIWNSTSLSLLRQKILTLLLQETSLKIQNKIWNLRQNCKCRFL